jgi:DNA-directed RNA polymerase subunit E'/Rpb7
MSIKSNISYLSNQILSDSIHLSPNELNVDNITESIIKLLINKNENTCNEIGYVIKNTVKLISKQLGELINIGNKNQIIYNVKYSSTILKPTEGDIIECYIENINKMGLLCYIKLGDILNEYDGENNMTDSPLIIIIPLNLIKNNINDYNIKQKIKIKVNATRNKYKSDKIQLIGEIV